MSDVAKISAELARYSEKLAIATNQYSDACRDAAEKRSTYDVEKAKALLRSKLDTVSERQAEAVISCEVVMREARIAESLREALKERVRALEAVLNATQSRAGFLKEEMRLTGRSY